MSDTILHLELDGVEYHLHVKEPIASAIVLLVERMNRTGAQLDAANAKLDAVRKLHQPTTTQVITGDCATEDCNHESVLDCPTSPMDVCLHCRDVVEAASYYALESSEVWALIEYPCPTIRALDGED